MYSTVWNSWRRNNLPVPLRRGYFGPTAWNPRPNMALFWFNLVTWSPALRYALFSLSTGISLFTGIITHSIRPDLRSDYEITCLKNPSQPMLFTGFWERMGQRYPMPQFPHGNFHIRYVIFVLKCTWKPTNNPERERERERERESLKVQN